MTPAGRIARILGRPSTLQTASTRVSVSVIVPFFNSGVYLEDCVESILRQSLTTIEIILVDDGSTDGSADVARRLASRDPRVTVLIQENSGPGGARNNGVSAAVGTYLTFVDSDDRLPPGALKALLRSAETKRADVVVGAIGRFNLSRSWLPEWSKAIHAEPRGGIRLEDLPGLLRNNYPVGKLYRRRFWLEQGLKFETNVIYEDQPLVAQMLSRAHSINVLVDIVYRYRQREDRSSISQRPEELPDLIDRAAAWRRSLAELGRETSASVLAAWYDTIYETHLHWYLDNESIVDFDYWQTLRNAFAHLRASEPAAALGKLPAGKRVALLLLDAGLQDEMIRFRAGEGYDLGRHPCQLTPEGPRYELPLTAETLAALPVDATVSPAATLELRQHVLRGSWGDGPDRMKLHLAGHAYVPTLGLRGIPTTIDVAARNPETGSVVRLDVRPSDDPALLPDHDHADYSASAYEASLDLSVLDHDSSNWDLFLTVTTGPYAVTEPMRNPSAQGGLGDAGNRMLDDDRRVRLVTNSNRHVGLRIAVEAPRAIVEQASVDGRELTVTFRSSDNADFHLLRATADGLGLLGSSKIAQLAPRRYRATVLLPALPGTKTLPPMISWTVRVQSSDGKQSALSWESGLQSADPAVDESLRVHVSSAGNLKLEESPRGCVVLTNMAEVEAGILNICVTATLPEGHEVDHFEAGSSVAESVRLSDSPTVLTARLDLGDAENSAESAIALPMIAVVRDPLGSMTRLPIMLSQQILSTLPIVTSDKSIRVQRSAGRTLGWRPLRRDR